MQIIVDEGIAEPQVIGRREVVESRLARLSLRVRLDRDFTITDPQKDPRFREYWVHYHNIMQRRGVSEDEARTVVRTRASVIGALSVLRGDSDAVICGAIGRYDMHLCDIMNVVGLRDSVSSASALQLLVTRDNSLFITDTNVKYSPNALQIAEHTILSSEMLSLFGIKPKVALISHSSFGSSGYNSAAVMRDALAMIRHYDPDLEVEGEMTADAALDSYTRNRLFPNSQLHGEANLLVMPSLDAANIAFNLTRVMTGGLSVGPILVGMARPAHVVTPAITVRGLVNMAALASTDAQATSDGSYSNRKLYFQERVS